MSHSTEERLIELEMKSSYQDDLLLKLNDIVSQQQNQIDRLEGSVLEVYRRLKELSNTSTGAPMQDDKPPHY